MNHAILRLPSRIDYGITKDVQTFIFNDDTVAVADFGKTGTSITLTGFYYENNGEWVDISVINDMMDDQEDVTITGLPDTELNTVYKIRDFGFTLTGGEGFHYKYTLTLERKYDRLG